MNNLPASRCDRAAHDQAEAHYHLQDAQDAPRRLSELQIQRACDLALKGVDAADILAGDDLAEQAALGWLTYWAATRAQPLPTEADGRRFLQVLEGRF